MSLFYQLQDAKETISELEEQNNRYREAIKVVIEDLKNECLWDALVRLIELEVENDE